MCPPIIKAAEKAGPFLTEDGVKAQILEYWGDYVAKINPYLRRLGLKELDAANPPKINITKEPGAHASENSLSVDVGYQYFIDSSDARRKTLMFHEFTHLLWVENGKPSKPFIASGTDSFILENMTERIALELLGGRGESDFGKSKLMNYFTGNAGFDNFLLSYVKFDFGILADEYCKKILGGNPDSETLAKTKESFFSIFSGLKIEGSPYQPSTAAEYDKATTGKLDDLNGF